MPLWLYWILLGLVAGTLAKFLVPGRDPSGCIVTIILGIVGALVAGRAIERYGTHSRAPSSGGLGVVRRLHFPQSCNPDF